MKSRHDMEFPDAFFGAACFAQDILDGHLVSARFTFAPAESAEFAAVDAEVRGVDMHVLDKVHPVGVLSLRSVGSHSAEDQKVMRAEQGYSLVAAQTLVG